MCLPVLQWIMTNEWMTCCCLCFFWVCPMLQKILSAFFFLQASFISLHCSAITSVHWVSCYLFWLMVSEKRQRRHCLARSLKAEDNWFALLRIPDMICRSSAPEKLETEKKFGQARRVHERSKTCGRREGEKERKKKRDGERETTVFAGWRPQCNDATTSLLAYCSANQNLNFPETKEFHERHVEIACLTEMWYDSFSVITKGESLVHCDFCSSFLAANL